MNGFEIPFRGMSYFFGRPHLWLLPLVYSVLFFFAMVLLFFGVVNWTWEGWNWTVLRSFAYGVVAILFFYLFFLPLFINLCFERLFKRILKSNHIPFVEHGLFVSFVSGIQVIRLTLFARLLWPIVTLLIAFFIPLLGIYLAHSAIVFFSILDGADMALALTHHTVEERKCFYRNHFTSILTGSIVGGFLSLFFSISVIGWLFFLPSLYIGGLLYAYSENSKSFL